MCTHRKEHEHTYEGACVLIRLNVVQNFKYLKIGPQPASQNLWALKENFALKMIKINFKYLKIGPQPASQNLWALKENFALKMIKISLQSEAAQTLVNMSRRVDFSSPVVWLNMTVINDSKWK